MYLKGEGVDQNGQQALYWYERAASQGHVTAQAILDNILQTLQNKEIPEQ